MSGDLQYNGVFPVEVYEHIIDIIASTYRDVSPNHNPSEGRERRKTLLACSLTCRAWLIRIRYHLYRTMTLYKHDELLHLTALIKAFPVVGQHIEVLQIFYPRGDYRSNLVFIYLSKLLTNVKSVVLSTFPWQGLRPIFFPLAAKFTSVTNLRIQTVGFMSSHDLTKFIFAFRSLQDLSISDIASINRRTYTLPTKLWNPLPLLTLDLATPVANLDILSNFRLTRSHESLKDVKMYVEKNSQPRLEIISNFLSGCISLRDLSFSTDVESFTSEGREIYSNKA